MGQQFKVGDRVRSLSSNRLGYVIDTTDRDGYIDVKFDDKTYGELPPIALKKEKP